MKKSPHYDPLTLRLELGGTAYEDAHEWAHVEQHARQTVAWRLWWVSLRIPVLCRLAVLMVEIEAAAKATREMVQCGIWEVRDGIEAIGCLFAYLRSLTIFSR